MMSPAAVENTRIDFKDSGTFRRVTLEGAALPRRSVTSVPRIEVPAPKRSRKPIVWFAAGLLVTAAGIYQPWKSFSAGSVAPIGEEAESLRTVSVERPSAVSFASVELPATIRPWQTTSLNARISGYLKSWHADLGASVKAGELLAEIDTPELDQETATAEALARESDAAVGQARAERVEAEADLKVAEAQLDRLHAEIELARSQLARREKLVASRSVSQEELETSQRLVEARTAEVAAAEFDITRRRSNLDTRSAIIEVREATAKGRHSNVDRLKELQGFKRIVAPFDGTVTRRSAEVGMLVTAGKETLFVVEDMSRVRVRIDVPQTYAIQTRIGTSAAITLPESSEPAVQGTITRISDSVDSTNRTMLAEIELDNTAHRFQPGSYAKVALKTSQSGSTWTIPTNTLAMRVSGPHVAVVDDRNRVEIRTVVLGRDLGKRVVVAEGLRGDERLVVNPGDDLADGVRIQVGNESKTRDLASR